MVSKRPEGWLEMRRARDDPEPMDVLAAHADWAGPVKLVERHGRIEQRVEFFPGPSADAVLVDDEAAQAHEDLVEELVRAGCALGAQTLPAGWPAPPAEVLAAWLTDAGHEAALDKEKTLRLTLKRPGFESEARARCAEGRLRFALPLGSWPALDTAAEAAMNEMARAVNAHSRLVRIARFDEGSARRFEAQGDLTGLPAWSDTDPYRERLWRETVRLAARGLDLAQRQLGLELPLLAEPKHRDLAELLLRRQAASG